MRWLICIAVLTIATGAHAERLVVNDPPMVRRCPKAKTWDLIVNCLSKVGTPKITKQLRGAKLVTMYQKQNARDVDMGVLLYVERRGEWRIGGRFETYGGEYRLLGFDPITIGKKAGYRIVVGQTSPFSLMVDSISPVPALLRMKRVLFCSGDSYHCPEATTDCDVSVEGRTWYLFRGTLEHEGNAIIIKGDRSRVGPSCNIAPKIYLGWPQT